MAVFGTFGTGRACRSVRAVVVNRQAWIGNGVGGRLALKKWETHKNGFDLAAAVRQCVRELTARFPPVA